MPADTWPTDRPGYPMHAERDGWHWLQVHDWPPHAEEWSAARREWKGYHGNKAFDVREGMCALIRYLGPCVLPADLDAAVQAERDACAETARDACLILPDGGAPTADEVEVCDEAERRIRARGPTSALDAAVAKARREGMEAAAKIVAASGLNGPGYAAIILAAMAGAPKEYDHRDNTPHDMAAGAAIRSAAAGEEGKP